MMFVEKGFVALYRKFKDWEWYQDSNTVRVFLHLLLSANWKPTRFAGSCIERGSCVLTRKRIAKDLNLTEQEVRTALNHLISTNEITCQSTNKFSILNIVKFNDYQVSENENQPTINQQNNQQINQQINQQTTSKSTNKNISQKPIQPTFQNIEEIKSTSKSTNKQPTNQPANQPTNQPYQNNICNNINNNIYPPLPPQGGTTVKKSEQNFILFWKAYPKKVGKQAALKAFEKVKVDINVLLEAIIKQKKSKQWQKNNGQFIPNPSTWLNQGRWDDELEMAYTGSQNKEERNSKYDSIAVRN